MPTDEAITVSAAQQKQILKAVEEVEIYAAILLDKCTTAKRLIEQAGLVSTKPKRQPALTPQQLAEISAKRRARLLKKAQKRNETHHLNR